jgi:hypothetical protein
MVDASSEPVNINRMKLSYLYNITSDKQLSALLDALIKLDVLNDKTDKKVISEIDNEEGKIYFTKEISFKKCQDILILLD